MNNSVQHQINQHPILQHETLSPKLEDCKCHTWSRVFFKERKVLVNDHVSKARLNCGEAPLNTSATMMHRGRLSKWKTLHKGQWGHRRNRLSLSHVTDPTWSLSAQIAHSSEMCGCRYPHFTELWEYQEIDMKWGESVGTRVFHICYVQSTSLWAAVGRTGSMPQLPPYRRSKGWWQILPPCFAA